MRYIVPVFYGTLINVLRVIVYTFARVEVVGKENLPRRGAMILASNHLNNVDPPVLATALPRRLTFMAKQEMFQWPVVGLITRLAGAFPVHRSEADLGALHKASDVLRRGEILTMFPEGSRSRNGKLRKAHPGTALLALRSEVPILPVAITGTETIALWRLPFDLVRLRRPRLRIVIGHPFFLPPVERATAEEAKRCTDLIMGHIAALLPPSYRGQYADAADSDAPVIERTR